ncbi:transposase [Hydrogenophaga aquatica]
MGKFPSDKHFASWLGLCPGTKITGGKAMSCKTKLCANRAAQALRLAVAAHKLARLIYAMLTQGPDYYEEHYRQRVLHHLAYKAMGTQLVPPTPAA